MPSELPPVNVSDYERAVHDSDIGKDLYESRNMKQPFAKGLIVGGAYGKGVVYEQDRQIDLARARLQMSALLGLTDHDAWVERAPRELPAALAEMEQLSPGRGTVGGAYWNERGRARRFSAAKSASRSLWNRDVCSCTVAMSSGVTPGAGSVPFAARRHLDL